MADSYKVLTSHPTIELVGSTDTQDVIMVWIETTPSGIRYPLRVPDATFSASAVAGLAGMYSPKLESWLHHPGVAGIRYEEVVNVNGDLTDTLVFTIQSANGQLQSEVREPMSVLLLGDIGPLVDPAISELDKVAGL